jgi:hypothetical protein
MRFLAIVSLGFLWAGQTLRADPLVFDIYDQHGWSCDKQMPEAPCLMPTLVAMLAERSGVDVRAETVPVPRLADRLRRGQSHFALMARKSAPGITLLGEVVGVELLAVGRRHGRPIKSYDDLYRLPLGVGLVLGASYNLPITEDPLIPRVDLTDGILGLRMLAAGRLDVLVGTQITLTAQARETRLESELGDHLLLGRIPFRLAVAEENRDTPAVRAVAQAVEQLRTEGTIANLVAQLTNPLWAAR